MSSLKNDKGKNPMTVEQQAFYSRPPLKQKYGWSQEEINKALEDNIWIQALMDNPDPMRGISPLYHEGILRKHEIIPFMYYDVPTNDSEQLHLPLSRYNKYYITFAPLHPNDNP